MKASLEVILKRRLNYFIVFLASQHTMINNDGSGLLSELFLKTYKQQSNAYKTTCTSDDILRIIQILDSEKLQGHDKTDMLMSKTCSPSKCKAFEIISNYVWRVGFFHVNRRRKRFDS